MAAYTKITIKEADGTVILRGGTGSESRGILDVSGLPVPGEKFTKERVYEFKGQPDLSATGQWLRGTGPRNQFKID